MATKMIEKSIGWQKSINLAHEVYKITKLFPKEEKYGLANQIQRCAVSIPSNIAEGIMRHSKNELAQFLIITRGSCGELVTQLTIALKLNYITPPQFQSTQEKLEEIIRILQSSIKTLKNKK